MKRQRLISVIVPAFNFEKYIERCLKGVLRQTYENFEVIVVDDGSKDGTTRVCEKIAKTDNRIKVIAKEHGGVSKARNCGLDSASGELVTFFDSDDFPEPTVLEEYARAYEEWKESVSFVLCGMYWENQHDRLVPQEKHILEPVRGYIEGKNYLLQYHDVSTLSWNKLFNFITNKCYLMRTIEENKIRFKEGVQIAEDMLFNLDYLEASKGSFIGVINKPLYHYVKHGSVSLSTAYYDGAIEHVCKSFDRLLDFELRQPGVSKDDEYVIESIYLMDWVSRLSAFMEDKKSKLSKKERYKICNDELRKPKFRKILVDSHKGRKIGGARYITLKICSFELFYLMRILYHGFRRENKARGYLE